MYLNAMRGGSGNFTEHFADGRISVNISFFGKGGAYNVCILSYEQEYKTDGV